MYFTKTLLIAGLLSIPFQVIAQPGVEMVALYDMVGSEQILDVYALQDGGYALCGSVTGGAMGRPTRGDPIVIRTDQGGNAIWTTRIELAGNDAFASSIIQTENGDFLCGGYHDGQFSAYRVSGDGELIWVMDYCTGRCWGVIELKNGDFILAGDYEGGGLIRIDGEGEVIWSRAYTPGWLGHFCGLRESDGGVVAAGSGMVGNNENSAPWSVKVRLEDGEPIWNRIYHNEDLTSYTSFGMTSSGDGGFAIAGTCLNTLEYSGEDFFVLRLNNNGEQEWIQTYPRDNIQIGRAITRLSDGGFAIVGESTRIGPPLIYPSIIRIDPQGEARWETTYEMQENERFDKGSNIFWGVTTSLDDEIIGCGAVLNAISDNYDGFLMKLEPDLPNPAYLNYTPEDTVFSILPDTTITFTVVPRELDPLEFEYGWLYRDTLRSNDTLCTLTFDSLGAQIVSCTVTQGQIGTTIRWHINVTDLYIYSFTPDTLNLQVRRNTPIDFSLDSIAASEEGDLRYLWTVTNLENFEREEIDTTAHTTITLRRAGDFQVEGNAYRGELIDKVAWNIRVNSAIRDYWPSTMELTVPADSVITFGIDPFDPASPNLIYSWYADSTLINDSAITELSFAVGGLHSVLAIVTDSVNTDTLLWQVTVLPNRINDPVNLIPSAAKLSLSPNPFNARSTIKYAVPTPGVVRLRVFDPSGREITVLVDAVRTPGAYAAQWDASDFPTGIYLLRLETPEATLVAKAVLLK